MNSTMVVPISDALRECLKDPHFLHRLDGFILQVREWRDAMAGDEYHSDSEHRYISTHESLALVFGANAWSELELGLPDANDLNDVLEWAASQTKDPESEDPGSES